MIPLPHRAFVPAMIALVGLGAALPAPASPLRPIEHQPASSRAALLVDCDVSLRNACYLRMNECLYRNAHYRYARRPPNLEGEIRACEAAYFDCVSRYRC